MASSWLVELVWLNNNSIPNFSIKGSQKVAQKYLSGVGWGGLGGFTEILILISVQIGLNLTSQLELSLATNAAIEAF